MDGEILLRGQVRIKEVGTKFRIAAGVSDLIETRCGEVALWAVFVKISETVEERSVVASCIEGAEVGWQAAGSPIGITRRLPRKVITATGIGEGERQPA